MAVNTLFQLAVHPHAELGRAASLLLLPELLVRHLTGVSTGEVTSAGTTRPRRRRDRYVVEGPARRHRRRPGVVPGDRSCGHAVGSWRGVPVHLVGGHDTASAVAARPAGAPAASAFVSTGTWLLVGAERPEPDTSEAARLANFSNEPGALGGVRFLKNVTGLWLLERCRAQWHEPPPEALVAAAAGVAAGGPIVDPNDGRFANPVDMEAEIRAAAGLGDDASRAAVVRCILDSLAAATSRVVDELATFLGSPVERLDVLGGGGRIGLLVRLLEEACGIDVVVGPAEATAIGNARIQSIALGHQR